MAFDIRINGDIAILVLSGDVDLQTTSDMKNDIVDIIGITQLDIDASDVTYIDSSGIAVLLLARQHCLQNNITINFMTASSAIYRVLQMAKLETILPITKVIDHVEDTGALGLGGGDAFSASFAGDDPISHAQQNDDPLMQNLLDEADTISDDNEVETLLLNMDSPEFGATETANTPFGEAVSDEALTRALLADIKDHEDDLKTDVKPAAGMSVDQPNPVEHGDDPDMSSLKPGNFS
ncbi:STAS domain-containing protein [Candidatus Puniceispirillum sp.]|uniref:STAS domain-containing protein n=1 Tax=Candidatus Puniceispirillum sp. TaxID=2026719 RepID=UPI003F695744